MEELKMCGGEGHDNKVTITFNKSMFSLLGLVLQWSFEIKMYCKK